MSGHKTAGTGSPHHFLCPGLRRIHPDRREGRFIRAHTWKPTGGVRAYRSGGKLGRRSDPVSCEWGCQCGRTGWSNHTDVVQAAIRMGLVRPSDLVAAIGVDVASKLLQNYGAEEVDSPS